MAEDSFTREMYDAMQEGKPLKRYIKTILGVVWVTALSPFDGKPQPVALKGQPKKGNHNAIVRIWSTMEDQFFKEMNREHFKAGNVRELKVTEQPPKPKPSPNQIDDEEIREILNKPFLSLKNKLNKFTKPAPVARFLMMAEEMEKSEKITDAIRARLSELEFGPKPDAEDVKEDD
jgi:hypothetical protein